MDWQSHLLGYCGQLLLHYWQTSLVCVCRVSCGRGCWVGVAMIAFGLLNIRRYCAMRLEGKSQVKLNTYLCFSRRAYTYARLFAFLRTVLIALLVATCVACMCVACIRVAPSFVQCIIDHACPLLVQSEEACIDRTNL